jgi:hypothetical protein
VNSFSVDSAQTFSREGRIAEWVHAFLLGPGDNKALSDGLKRDHRHWIGPIQVPIKWLDRCCGPEREMEYPEDPQYWSTRIADIAKFIRSGGDVPPLIVEYRGDGLSVRDGSHRLGALEAENHETAWILIWYDSRPDYELHRAKLMADGIEANPTIP